MCYYILRRIVCVCGEEYYIDSKVYTCEAHERWIVESRQWELFRSLTPGIPHPQDSCPGLRHRKRKDKRVVLQDKYGRETCQCRGSGTSKSRKARAHRCV